MLVVILVFARFGGELSSWSGWFDAGAAPPRRAIVLMWLVD